MYGYVFKGCTVQFRSDFLKIFFNIKFIKYH